MVLGLTMAARCRVGPLVTEGPDSPWLAAREGSEIMRTICLVGVMLLQAGAQVRDISGTWVGKMQARFGEVELTYQLKVENGKITGKQILPFAEWPIVDGKTDGDQFEFTVNAEFFGNAQKLVVKGEVAGDELRVTPAMPVPPPGQAPEDAREAFRPGLVVMRRGIPTPSYRAPAVDYSKLPKVELPAPKEIPDNGLAETPPMGWNSWNKFATKIDDKTVREIADALVASGMRDAGYAFVNIDDGWQGERDEKGVLRPNPHFPDMKALADYVHAKGLKLGIYSSPGPRTCAGFEGSYSHEAIDAKTWADWGIDYLKYDWCSAGRVWKDEDMQAVYQRMGEALRAAGRPIVYSLCQYGRAKVQEWAPKVGGNLWRTTWDIRDRWKSMDGIGFGQFAIASYARPGHWNDPDMLEIGNGGMTNDEYRTHMTLWSLLAAPLLAGNDLRAMNDETKSILMNREVIAIDQDPSAKPVTKISEQGPTLVAARPLYDNSLAVGLFNRGEAAATIIVRWADLGLQGKLSVRDLWAHQDLGARDDQFSVTVPPHGVVLIRVKR